jgi:Undecaprenyl-phosphate galactose phosphotransferase WbaP
MSFSPSTAIPIIDKLEVSSNRPARMLFCLLASDAISLCCAVLVAGWSKGLAVGGIDLEAYLRLWPFLPVFLLLYMSAGLYSGLALSPPEELRRATLCSSIGFVLLSIITASLRGATNYFKPALFIAILVSVVLVPLLRARMRSVLGNKSWWGYPAVFFGPFEKTHALIEICQKNPGLGLKPIARVHEDDDDAARPIRGVTVVPSDDIPSELARAGVYAVIMADASRSGARLLRECSKFSHVLAIPDLLPLEANLWISPRAVGSFLGLEMKRKLLQPEHLAAKRVLDVTLALLTTVVCAPVLLAIALGIRLSSPGPILYRQQRIGRHGRRFDAYKFRTMLTNSEELLQKSLADSPELRAEWERDHKLKNDPRVSSIGRFLRKASLDELPQLWNVLRGDMSLVGPRPIVDAEIVRYGNSFDLYASVAGGVTGLWQVSGRNDTS